MEKVINKLAKHQKKYRVKTKKMKKLEALWEYLRELDPGILESFKK